MDEKDIRDMLWRLYQEHYTHIRHYESQRSTVTNLLIIIAAALLAFTTYDKAITRADTPLACMLFLIGLFGAAFSIKYHERASLHYQRILKYREKLDKLFDPPFIIALKEEADQQLKAIYPRLNGGRFSWVKVHKLWIVFHLLISLFGLALIVWATFWPQSLPAGS
jgi:hypothetical protein